MSLKQWAHRKYKQLEVDSHILRYMFLEITRQCNLNCRHCGSDCTQEMQSAELTTDSWIKIIDHISDASDPSLSFILTGGEPLLHPEWEKISAAIQKKGRRWGMVSNGYILDEKRMNKMEELGMYSMTISLDGNLQGHEWLRNRKGTFSRVCHALELLGRSSVSYKDVVTCVYPGNLDQLAEVANILMDKGISSWRLFRIFPSGRAQGDKELMLDKEKTRQLLTWIRDNKKFYQQKGLSINYSCEGYMPLDLDLKVRDHAFMCWAGVNIASILSDGTITGCSNNASRFYEGNILKDNFFQVWQEKFTQFRNRDWAKNGSCGECSDWKDCQGSSIHLWQDGEQDISFCYKESLVNK